MGGGVIFKSRALLRLDMEARLTRDFKSRFLTGLSARFGMTRIVGFTQILRSQRTRSLRMTKQTAPLAETEKR
jgi:hypothetical protein